MAKMQITNSSSADIVDRNVNTKLYTIRAGETVTMPADAGVELLKIYGFLSGSEVEDAEAEEKEEVEVVAEPEVVEPEAPAEEVPVEEPPAEQPVVEASTIAPRTSRQRGKHT